ncbi:MAG: DUF1427 family protein [Elusimicrobia bacterium]|nr:DUF1427 family protein [Elusimicrobiota bacterium]
MKEILASLLTGLMVGVLFGWIRLPIPAPHALSGVIGIFGIYLGYCLIHYLLGR